MSIPVGLPMASLVGFLLIGTVYFKGFETVKIDKGNPVVIEQKIDRDNLEEPEIINETVLPSQVQKTIVEIHKAVADNNNLKKQPKQLNNKEEEALIINQSKENDAVVNSSENKNYQSTSINKYISAEKLLAEVTNTKFEPKATDKVLVVDVFNPPAVSLSWKNPSFASAESVLA